MGDGLYLERPGAHEGVTEVHCVDTSHGVYAGHSHYNRDELQRYCELSPYGD